MQRLLRHSMIAAGAMLLLAGLQSCSGMGTRLGLFLEEGKINAAARNYLDAEIRRDLKTVYACLAPSSHYMAVHPAYEDYLQDAQESPVRIVDYKIIGIANLRDNHDPDKYPRIEKFVQVEVDITFLHKDNNATVPVNYSFTFIKEGGKWYKG
jgi:hypothetical protein